MVLAWKENRKADDLIVLTGTRIFAGSSKTIFEHVLSGLNEDIMGRLRNLNLRDLELVFHHLKKGAEMAFARGKISN
jgi:hypothetical protein